jgi:predicted adenylyl cyclase CyaB
LARNVELKARLDDLAAVITKASGLATDGPTEMLQEDIFFRCDAGRLKLRVFSPDLGELIFYRRPDLRGPKESYYLRSPTSAPETMREALASAYGEVGRVRKHRTVFLVGRTRVHIDRVEGLGDFLELEVVLQEGESAGIGENEAQHLMQQLGIDGASLVDRAYIDLLLQR